MYILGHVGSLDECVVCKHVLLAGLSGLGLHCLLDGVAVGHAAGLQGLDVGGALCDGDICNGVGQVLEVSVARHEIGLAAEAHEESLSACDAALHRTLGSLAVRALRRNELAFLTNDADGLVEVAAGFLEGLLAVHHSRRSHLT